MMTFLEITQNLVKYQINKIVREKFFEIIARKKCSFQLTNHPFSKGHMRNKHSMKCKPCNLIFQSKKNYNSMNNFPM